MVLTIIYKLYHELTPDIIHIGSISVDDSGDKNYNILESKNKDGVVFEILECLIFDGTLLQSGMRSQPQLEQTNKTPPNHNEKIQCECSKIVSKSNMSKHRKTKRHLANINIDSE